MLLRWTSSLISTALLLRTAVTVSASPVISTTTNEGSVPRGEDLAANGFREALGASAASVETLSLRDERKPYFRICRNEDGRDCINDVTCTIAEYISAPLLFIIYGRGDLLNMPALQPWHLLPSGTLVVCLIVQSRFDASIPGQSRCYLYCLE